MRSFYRSFGKRAFDLWAVVSAAPFWVPLTLGVAILVRLRLGSPVLFRQERPGYEARPFELLKFRTMTDATGPDGELLPDADRLLPFGRFLRRASLDELPSLWNVVRGELSLVGPRPLLVKYLERYTPRQARRHEVRPGITGRAQIHGRNAISWDDKLEHDVRYVDDVSFLGDLRILAATVLHVLRATGISADGHATMPEFHSEAEEREREKDAR